MRRGARRREPPERRGGKDAAVAAHRPGTAAHLHDMCRPAQRLEPGAHAAVNGALAGLRRRGRGVRRAQARRTWPPYPPVRTHLARLHAPGAWALASDGRRRARGRVAAPRSRRSLESHTPKRVRRARFGVYNPAAAGELLGGSEARARRVKTLCNTTRPCARFKRSSTRNRSGEEAVSLWPACRCAGALATRPRLPQGTLTAPSGWGGRRTDAGRA